MQRSNGATTHSRMQDDNGGDIVALGDQATLGGVGGADSYPTFQVNSGERSHYLPCTYLFLLEYSLNSAWNQQDAAVDCGDTASESEKYTHNKSHSCGHEWYFSLFQQTLLDWRPSRSRISKVPEPGCCLRRCHILSCWQTNKPGICDSQQQLPF